MISYLSKALLLSLSASTLALGAGTPAANPVSAPAPRTTFLVPLPEQAAWQDLAFLAAVPAATVANDGALSLIALEASGAVTPEITDYAARYRPDTVILLGSGDQPLTFAGRTCQRVDASSAADAARQLSTRFWRTSETVVVCPEGDYESGVIAAALAARLRAPLLFAGNPALSAATAREIARLHPKDLLDVGHCGPCLRALPPGGARITELPTARDIMTWTQQRKIAVPYLAALNPLDRNHMIVRKLSLAGVMLAAGRHGLVAPLPVDNRWKTRFSGQDVANEPPTKTPASNVTAKSGTVTIDGQSVKFFLTAGPKEKDLKVYFDFNSDGDYQGPGEGPFSTGDSIMLGNKRQVITLGSDCGSGTADVRLSWPPVTEPVASLRQYYHILGAPPEFLCLVGFADAIPQEIRRGTDGVEETTSDLPYTNADDDPFAEISVARVIAENVSFATLFASRTLTYPALLAPEWQDVACQAQWENTYQKLFENVGFNASYRHTVDDLKWKIAPTAGTQGKREATFAQDSPLTRCALISHMDHSWWKELGGTFGWDAETLIAPTVVESAGCITAALDRETDCHSVVARLLRKGAVSFVGNAREGCAPQELQRMEFWTAVLAGKTIGQAHRQSINSALTTVLDKSQDPSGAFDYQLHIRTLFGDPAFRMRVPGPPKSAPAHTTVADHTVTVHAPAAWWPVKMFFPTDWKKWAGKELYVLRAAGTYARREWCDLEYDREQTCYTAEFTTKWPVARIEQLGNPPPPLGIQGTWHIDHHTDGSATYRWVVCLADFDQIHGVIVNTIDHLDYQVVER